MYFCIKRKAICRELILFIKFTPGNPSRSTVCQYTVMYTKIGIPTSSHKTDLTETQEVTGKWKFNVEILYTQDFSMTVDLYRENIYSGTSSIKKLATKGIRSALSFFWQLQLILQSSLFSYFLNILQIPTLKAHLVENKQSTLELDTVDVIERTKWLLCLLLRNGPLQLGHNVLFLCPTKQKPVRYLKD